MSKFIVSLLSLCFLLSSCENMTEKELEDTISSGVVLVQNQSYYEVVLSNGESIFFSSFDAEGDLDGLALDKDSVEVPRATEQDSLFLELAKLSPTLMWCQML